MFDAALASPAPVATPKPAAAIHPAAVAGALLLHLAGLGVLLWAAASHEPRRAEEPPAIELTLETVASQAPTPEAAPSEAAAPEPEPEAESPPEPPPLEPEPPPPPVEPPPPEPPPPARPEAVAPPPPPTPRPRPPQPPRERRAAPAAPPGAAPSSAPPASMPAVPAAPSGPPVVTGARFRRPPTPPDYPLVARERGITGTALIRALVGADGATKEVRLHRSSGNEALDGAALAAVRRWAFEPSSRDGQRIESWIEVPIRFQLR